MAGVHTEQAFEDAIEAHLLANGYLKGSRGDYDPKLAIDRAPSCGTRSRTSGPG